MSLFIQIPSSITMGMYVCFNAHFFKLFNWKRRYHKLKKQYIEEAVSWESDITLQYIQRQTHFFPWYSQIGLLQFKLSWIPPSQLQDHLTCQEKYMSQNASSGRYYAALNTWLFQHLEFMVLSLQKTCKPSGSVKSWGYVQSILKKRSY